MLQSKILFSSLRLLCAIQLYYQSAHSTDGIHKFARKPSLYPFRAAFVVGSNVKTGFDEEYGFFSARECV